LKKNSLPLPQTLGPYKKKNRTFSSSNIIFNGKKSSKNMFRTSFAWVWILRKILFSPLTYLFYLSVFQFCSWKKNSERIFRSSFCLENKFHNVFSEVFPKFELEKLWKTRFEVFSRVKLKYWGVEKICKRWEENSSNFNFYD
jgi:hypothetical protein